MPSFYAFFKIEYTQRKIHKLQVYSDEFLQTVLHSTVTSTRLRNDITSFQKSLHALSGTSPHTSNHDLKAIYAFSSQVNGYILEDRDRSLISLYPCSV